MLSLFLARVTLVVLCILQVQIVVARNNYETCQLFNSGWRTTYAPNDLSDVSYSNYKPVSPDAIPHPTCNPGNLVESFKQDALNRLNYYRYLTGLKAVTVSATNQAKSQKCALMMAVNNNLNSTGYHVSSDPHTNHPGWFCKNADAEEGAQLSNIYAGQSLPNPSFQWQTTPAYILTGMIDDYSSSKQGHRQNVFCPNLADVSFGHVCYYDSSVTKRYFCGGCQWAYGRNFDPMPRSGFISWPPADDFASAGGGGGGGVPLEIVPRNNYFYWSFAAFMNNADTGPSYNRITVTVDGVNTQVVVVQALCTGSGVSGERSDQTLTWLSFKPVNPFSRSNTSQVIISTPIRSWSYTVTLLECGRVLSSPPPTAFPTRQPIQPTLPPTQPLPPTMWPTQPTLLPTQAQTTGRPTPIAIVPSPLPQQTPKPTSNPTMSPFPSPTVSPIPSTLFPTLSPTPSPSSMWYPTYTQYFTPSTTTISTTSTTTATSGMAGVDMNDYNTSVGFNIAFAIVFLLIGCCLVYVFRNKIRDLFISFYNLTMTSLSKSSIRSRDIELMEMAPTSPMSSDEERAEFVSHMREMVRDDPRESTRKLDRRIARYLHGRMERGENFERYLKGREEDAIREAKGRSVVIGREKVEKRKHKHRHTSKAISSDIHRHRCKAPWEEQAVFPPYRDLQAEREREIESITR